MKQFRLKRSKIKGFSMVEVLTVIGVIGVISAIAIPGMTNINRSASEATARRNAQKIVSISESAKEAGMNFADPSGDVSVSVANVVNGGIVDGGAFDGTFFGLRSMTPDAQAAAIPYLQIEDGILVFTGHTEEGTVDVLDPEDPNGTANGQDD